ncbi:MAG: hypothetical protein PHO32_03490 [Candidatus Cloacimonetes bacterium]|nr:hypothetical protein [Candidatus Cloacimonadota bacterium]
MKKLTILFLTLLVALGLFAQEKSSDIDQWLYEQPTSDNPVANTDSLITNDIIQVNYSKKDARLAMVMSLLVPGAGQFYADKSSFTTYLFPVIELACIGGMIYYDSQGKDKAKAYEKYATSEIITYVTPDGSEIHTTRYNRGFQNVVQNHLKGINAHDIYDDGYFRLDTANTQHFYEDIGKYPHYVFGWTDWYYRFACDESGDSVTPLWVFDSSDMTNPYTRWIGNRPQWGENQSIYISANSHEASSMRKTYIEMRNDAKAEFAIARAFTFVLAANHLTSGLDALRLTRKVNRLSISQAKPQVNLYAAMPSGNITPMLGMKWNF